MRRKLVIDADAREALRALAPEPRRRVWAGIDTLREDPLVGDPLRDELAGLWKLRVGHLRIVYEFDDERILVELVDRRETAYEEAARRGRERTGQAS